MNSKVLNWKILGKNTAIQNNECSGWLSRDTPLTGGLGGMVVQAVTRNCPRTVKRLALSDVLVIAGTSQEIFNHYGLNVEDIAKRQRSYRNKAVYFVC